MIKGFGVKEPAVVFDVGKELFGDVGTDGLETALSVGETHLHGSF